MNTETKYTPGPWYAKQGQIAAENDPKGRTFALIPYYDHGPEQDANAQLIAAAPDLLDALKAVKAFALPGATHIHKICDDAIAKAEWP